MQTFIALSRLLVSGWRGHSQGHLGEEHAHDRSSQPGGGAGHPLLLAGHEPPGRHGESEALPRAGGHVSAICLLLLGAKRGKTTDGWLAPFLSSVLFFESPMWFFAFILSEVYFRLLPLTFSCHPREKPQSNLPSTENMNINWQLNATDRNICLASFHKI